MREDFYEKCKSTPVTQLGIIIFNNRLEAEFCVDVLQLDDAMLVLFILMKLSIANGS